MRGIELSRGYYETYGKLMIHEQFPEYEHRIAVGLVGEGSECFGFDDEISRDHDFGPAFCMWLNHEDIAAIGKQLQEAYENLPGEYGGLPVRRDHKMTGHRTGVWEIGDFYNHFLGTPGVFQDSMRWLHLPEHYFAVAVNGEVFCDEAGEFTAIREQLLQGYPEDIRIKKMVARAATMSQSGQYNYPRSVNRGEPVAAELALSEFIKNGMSMIYLLNHRYAPFYKWMHRGLRDLPIFPESWELFLSLTDDHADAYSRMDAIETICMRIAEEWKRQGLVERCDPFLQNLLPELMEKISDSRIRGLHWMEG
ncbi:MAG: DUF4037 domain-containing protein [Brotaphodocola sp.]